MIDLPLQHSHQHPHGHDHTEDETQHQNQSNLTEIPCHPHRPVASFDFTAIEQQIQIIRQKKEAAKLAARIVKKVKRTPNDIYESDVIDQVLQQSLDMVPIHLGLALKQRMKFIEDKVYIGAQHESNGEFVSRLKQEILQNDSLANQLNLVMEQVQLSIGNDIEEGTYQIHHIKRAQKIVVAEAEPAHRVKLKNMLIRSKLSDLKEQFNQSELISSDNAIELGHSSSSRVQKKEGQIWGDQFHLMSEGTKKAQQFVKKIQKEQIQIKKEKHKQRKQLQSLQVKSAMEHKQFEQQMKKEKHESLKKRYQLGRKQKQAQKQKQLKNESDYKLFLKQYQGRKPLFRIKEQQFLHNVLQQQERRRKSQLMQIHQAKKPMSHQQLLEHQKNYQKWKQDKQSQIVAERQMRRKEEANLPRKSFYRGKFHSFILEENQLRQKIIDPNQTRDALLKKQKQFAEEVRKKYAPLISQGKKQQLSELMGALERGKNQKALSEEAYRQLGNQYLRQVHKMIDQLRVKGLLKSQQTQQSKPKTRNYLKQVRDRYNFSTVDYSSQVNSNEQWVENKALKHQKDAKMKQKVLRYKHSMNFDLDKYMREVDAINDDYINSAQAKISLINKLQGKSVKQTRSKLRNEEQSSKRKDGQSSIREDSSQSKSNQ